MTTTPYLTPINPANPLSGAIVGGTNVELRTTNGGVTIVRIDDVAYRPTFGCRFEQLAQVNLSRTGHTFYVSAERIASVRPVDEDGEVVECFHTDTREARGNSGDGSAMYDFWTLVCNECGDQVGDVD